MKDKKNFMGKAFTQAQHVLKFMFVGGLCCGLMVATQAFGQKVIVDDQIQASLIKNGTIRYMVDSTNEVSIDRVLADTSDGMFSANAKDFVVIGNTDYTYWLSFDIENQAQTKRWVIENADAHISQMEVFFKMPDGRILKHKAGFGLDFGVKSFDHKNFIFDVPLEYGKQMRVYIKAKSDFHNPFVLYIKSFDYFTSYSLAEYVSLGIFYGILLIMIAYNLILYVAIKEKIYIYYCFYVVSAMFISLSEDGLGFQYVWPHLPKLNYFLFNYSPAFFVVSFILYAKSFLDIRSFAPRYNKFVSIIGWVFSFYFIIKSFGVKLPWNTSLFIIPALAVYIAGFMAKKRDVKLVNYFIIANSILLVSLVITFVRMSGIIHDISIVTVYSFNIGLVLEIVLFSFTMSERFRLVKKEKEKADQDLISQLHENAALKDKVNQELEQKVAERTQALAVANKDLEFQKEKLEAANELLSLQAEELETANEHLKLQSDEIQRMNAILNQENADLQSNVVELSKARVMLKDVNFEEFSRIFPDAESCMTYLSDIKWKHGYTCRKCGNTKHVATDDKFSYRCTKCRYNESAMAYSIFHKCKFPLNKAFYILFLIYASKDKITSQELSDVLQLRLSTCWHFSKKVKEAMGNKKRIQINEKAGLDGWAALIPTEEE